MDESLKNIDMRLGHPMTGVSIKEPDTGRLKPLLEAEGKGKGLATDEQAAQTLLHISSLASNSKDIQYIFKKRSPETSKTNVEYSEDTQEQFQSQEHVTQSSDSESDMKAYKEEENALDTATTGLVQERSVMDSPSHVKEHTVEPHSSLQDEFVATIYPTVQVNLKLKSDEQKLTIEHDTSIGTLSSFKQLDQDFTYGDLDVEDKPTDTGTEKTSDEKEVMSMVSVPIEQDYPAIPTMSIPMPTTTPPMATPTPTTTTSATATTTMKVSNLMLKRLSLQLHVQSKKIRPSMRSLNNTVSY